MNPAAREKILDRAAPRSDPTRQPVRRLPVVATHLGLGAIGRTGGQATGDCGGGKLTWRSASRTPGSPPAVRRRALRGSLHEQLDADHLRSPGARVSVHCANAT